MSELPPCPNCASDLSYADGEQLICPECGHEWQTAAAEAAEAVRRITDAHGTPLADGDSVVVIKDLKVRGSSATVKIGTKVRNIRLVEGDHDIDCRIEGFGAMQLKSAFVKKA